MDESTRRVEEALTRMVRRIDRVYLYRDRGSQLLERSAYLVLSRLFDHGPQRMSELAAVYELDISTVSRQVQSLEANGLLVRDPDPSDRRANLLGLTEAGLAAIKRTRQLRRGVLRRLLKSWSSADVADFARLLERLESEWQSTDVLSLLREPELLEDLEHG